jgi:hypothetical protein
MALRRHVMTLFEKRVRPRRRASRTDRRDLPEATLEAMFAYQHELSTIPRQRRGSARD